MFLGQRPAPGTLLKKHSSPKKSKNSKWRDEREGMDREHVKNIRDLPCCVPRCDVERAGTIHHLKDIKEERGASVRSTDQHGLPMCPTHHDEIERAGTKNETKWFEQRGIDPKGLARALWNSRGNPKAMVGIIRTHKAIANNRGNK
jgi:hypothetical protein